MTNIFALKPISLDELESAESSSEFTAKLDLNPYQNAYLINFGGSNTRCNDHVSGQILLAGSTIKDFKIDRTGCSLSKACIVSFSNQLIGLSPAQVVSITDKDWLEAVGTSHPMRNECVLFGVKAIQKALSSL
jgi:NifU-like protein involved in Fe-S cluster formation